ncbi:hypothetical protein GCM10025865_22420 [Paraoerskovia sediminicola]|uniref:D-alanyl-D-alanine carboxypeptidase-like core domain-containing protein n=1 Tax=Paraoerskovia sediminicola TaxID=1138587 RepID=A0ABM8G4E8_9CELL|nr:M15 family metallopeptidase [Paraoerskovia sediminicola]BDZ42943.1 hypothetical protein GCM10025865_22420 [Paraoerskovia sediminicola]
MDQHGPAPMTRRAMREAQEREAKESARRAGRRSGSSRHASSSSRRAASPAGHVAPTRGASTVSTSGTSGTSARRAAAAGATRRAAAAQPQSPALRVAPRAAVLASLAVATIAVPLTGAAGPDAVRGQATAVDGPDLVDVVVAEGGSAGVPVAVASAPRDRSETTASRAGERSALPGCDPQVRPAGTNGQLDEHALCELWDGKSELRPDAAVSLAAFNQAFRAAFGRDLCLVSSYRSYGSQVGLSYSRAGYAARPGTSMHGWGVAVDLCSEETRSESTYGWILDNIGTYGWSNPDWASGGYEPWHLQYDAAVAEYKG